MFSKFEQTNKELKNAASITVNQVLRTKKGERVLIITNDEYDVFTIAKALFDEFEAVGASPSLIIQKSKNLIELAEDSVSMAIRSECEIMVSLSAEKMGKDRYALAEPYFLEKKEITSAFNYLQATKKCRSFWAPGVTVDIFTKAVPINYDQLAKECSLVKKVMDDSLSIHLSSDAGMDFYIGTQGRVASVDDGNFTIMGDGGNLPAGESYISPALESCHGTIIFDGSVALMKGTMLCDKPVVVTVSGGYVTDIKGGIAADELLKTIISGEKMAIQWEQEGHLKAGQGTIYAKNARHIGELGIGLNPKAIIMGNMLIDEKAYESCHIAIGSNYDDDAHSLIHLDCLCKNPTIVATMADGSQTTILHRGVLQLK